MKQVYIADAARTAVGSFGGMFANTSAADLGAVVVKALLEKNKVTGADIDEMILGCVLQANLGQNVARQVEIKAGFPVEKTAQTINMVCGSGLRAVADAARAVAVGECADEGLGEAPHDA